MADRILQLDSGRIILPTFHSESGLPFDAFCYYSDDDGRSWGASETRMGLPGHGAQEPSVAVLRDGSLLAVLRTSLGTLHRSNSYDEGENWTQPVSTGLPSPASTPLLKRIPTTGDLLLIWNHVYDPDHADFQNGHGPRDPLTMAISRDEGESWENVKDIESRPGGASSTPAVTFVGDEVLLTYNTQGVRLPEHEKMGIRLKIIPVEWFNQ
jgi:sialidase-1